MPRAAEVIKMFDNVTEDMVKMGTQQGRKVTKEAARKQMNSAVKANLIPHDIMQQELKRASQSVGEVVKNDAKYAGRTFRVDAKDMNKIKTNKGEGFFKTIMSNASRIADGPVGQVIDEHTGLPSFISGFTKEGSKGYEGNAVSKAAQKAGYISKNAEGEIDDINFGKIAKGYLAASATTRVVTGGGLYKDGQGNTNIIGVPLI